MYQPQSLQPLISVDKTPTLTELNINTQRNSIVSDLYDAATTIDEDPGNYKKKALLGAAATAAGAIALSRSSNAINTVANSAPKSLLATLTRYAFPAGIYYAVQNFADRPTRSLGGAAVAAGSLASLSSEVKDKAVTQKALDSAKTTTSLGGGAVVLPAIYTVHQLENAKREKDLAELKTNTTLHPIQKAEALNAIRNRTDMYARYPALRLIPGSGIIRDLYNEHHKPEAKVRASDATEFQLLAPKEELDKMRYKND